MRIRKMGFIAGMISSAAVAGYAAGEAAVGLRVELLRDIAPATISVETPKFSWEIASREGGEAQVAYRIQVAPTAAMGFEAPNAVVWDSGKTESSVSIGREYAGAALRAGGECQWRVKVWLSESGECHWSEPMRFRMAPELKAIASRHPVQASPVEPVSERELELGRCLLDFGKVAFGYLELSLTASESGVVTVHFGERGIPSSGIFRELPETSSVRYYQVPLEVTKGAGVYRVQPPKDARNTKPVAIEIPGRFGTIAPFRYVEIESEGLTLESVEARQIALHYPFEEYASSFESSDALLNDIWELCKYSMKATSFAGVYVDGDRERIPYEADAYINMLSHYAVDAEYSIGRYTHEYLMDYETWPTEWKQHSVMLAYMDWVYTGDASSIERTFDGLKATKTLEYLPREDGLLVSFPYERPGVMADIVDWPPAERANYEYKKVNTVVNSFYYLNMRQMAEMAVALGREEDAKRYEAAAEDAFEAFNETLFDEKSGLYVDGKGATHSSLHANLFPLAFGLVPEERMERVVDFVIGEGMGVSVYGAQYLLEALYSAGRDDAALALMTSREKRSWYNMLAVGSTITLEAWDDAFKPNQDWNHAWGGAPANIISRFLLGVRPLKPGFGEIFIAPRLGGLGWAKGRVPTIRGPVDIEVRSVPDESMRLELSLPGNTETTVSLAVPAGRKVGSVLLNGEKAAFDERSGALVIEGLQSGTYRIELAYE